MSELFPPEQDAPQAISVEPVILVSDEPVMLAARVAHAFGVETREVIQAVKRKPLKFKEIHAFELTEEDVVVLTSQGVISKPGRGGSCALGTVINPRTKATVRDELEEVGGSALDYLKAHLRKKGLENERIEAETIHILEKVREIRARTEADVHKSAAETERLNLENLDKKITIVEKLLQMADRMEPNAVVDLLGNFAPTQLLPAPQHRRMTRRGQKSSES